MGRRRGVCTPQNECAGVCSLVRFSGLLHQIEALGILNRTICQKE